MIPGVVTFALGQVSDGPVKNNNHNHIIFGIYKFELKTKTINSNLRGQLVISKHFSFVDILTNIESQKRTSQSLVNTPNVEFVESSVILRNHLRY